MSAILTIRLDASLESLLDSACASSGRTRSDLAREALKKQLSLRKFESLREQVIPFAEKAGFLVDEDVFEKLS